MKRPGGSLPEGTRLRVVDGGATPEEAVAVLLALELAAAADASAAAPPRRPAWQRAARLEALGQAPVASAVDPRLDRREARPTRR